MSESQDSALQREAPGVGEEADTCFDKSAPVLSPEERAAVAAVGVRLRFERGEHVIRAGERGDTVFFVERGHFLVVAGGTNGVPTALAMLGEGTWFGEFANFIGESRTATVRALGPSAVIAVGPSQFEELCRSTPNIRDNVMLCLVHKLIEASRRVVEMAEISAGVRVMRELARAAAAFGQAEDGGVIRLTQEQVACLAGAGIRSTSQALAVARKSGAIETHKRQIRVIDWNALLAAAEISV